MAPLKTPLFLEMVGTWLFNDTIDQTWACTKTPYDPADYTGLTLATFEVVGLHSGSSTSANESVSLVDGGGTVLGTLTFSPKAAGVTSPYREERKSVTVTLPASSGYLYVKSIAGNGNLNFREARVILDIDSPSRLRPQVHMISGDESAGGGFSDTTLNDFYAYALSCTNSTYAYGGSTGTSRKYFRQFLYTSANWATVDHWTVSVVAERDTSGSGTGYIALYNKTTDTVVAGTELTFTETTPTLKSVDFASALLTDTNEYEFRVKWANTGGATQGFLVCRAELYPTLTPVTVIESHLRVGSPIMGTFPNPAFNAGYDPTARFRYQSSKFPASTPIYFESTGQETGGSASMYLSDVLISDVQLGAYSNYASAAATTSGTAWSNPSNATGQEDSGSIATTLATVAKAASGDPISELELSSFGFDGQLPPTAPITGVFIETFGAIYNSGLSSGSTAGQICAIPYVSGSPVGSYICSACSESEISPGVIVSSSLFSTFTTARSWVVADFDNAVFTVRVENYETWSGGNVGRTFAINAVKVTVETAIDVTSSKLDFSTSAYERQRSSDIASSLVDGDRYVVHYALISSGQTVDKHSSAFLIAVVSGSGSASASVSPSASLSPSLSPSPSIPPISPSASLSLSPSEECSYHPFSPSPGATVDLP